MVSGQQKLHFSRLFDLLLCGMLASACTWNLSKLYVHLSRTNSHCVSTMCTGHCASYNACVAELLHLKHSAFFTCLFIVCVSLGLVISKYSGKTRF